MVYLFVCFLLLVLFLYFFKFFLCPNGLISFINHYDFLRDKKLLTEQESSSSFDMFELNNVHEATWSSGERSGIVSSPLSDHWLGFVSRLKSTVQILATLCK